MCQGHFPGAGKMVGQQDAIHNIQDYARRSGLSWLQIVTDWSGGE